ncbi:MAG: hypothetical protein K2P74_04430 [Nitrosomonas sp.]|nr:hypothetical protein [Nitrosomonas sp.]
MRDYKDYEAQDGAMLVKAMTWLLVGIIFAAIAYTSTADYNECMAGNKSVAMCGGGVNK